MGQGSDNFEDQLLADKYETHKEVQAAPKKTKRITKAAILREARRVYGDALVSVAEEKYFSERPFRFTTEIILKRFRSGVFVQALSRAEASRMALAALQAAGSAK